MQMPTSEYLESATVPNLQARAGFDDCQTSKQERNRVDGYLDAMARHYTSRNGVHINENHIQPAAMNMYIQENSGRRIGRHKRTFQDVHRISEGILGLLTETFVQTSHIGIEC